MTTPPRVALIGAGPIGRFHLAALRGAGADVVGLCTRQEEEGAVFAAEEGIKTYCTSVRDLFGMTSAQAVVVAVPISESFRVYREVMQHPWVSLLEKPLGLDLTEARHLLAEARSTGHRGFIGLNRRHLASTRTAVSVLATSTGQRTVRVLDQQDRIKARTFGHPQEVVDNFMYANSIHLVDYLKFLARGRVTSLSHVSPWTGELGSVVEVELKFDSGDRGHYRAVWEQDGPWSVSVEDAESTLVMRPLEKLTRTSSGTLVTDDIDYSEDQRFKPGYLEQARAFLRALSGSTTCPSLDDALETTQLVAQIYGLS